MTLSDYVIYFADYVWNTLMIKEYIPGISFKAIFVGLWIMAILMAALRNLMDSDIDIQGI